MAKWSRRWARWGGVAALSLCCCLRPAGVRYPGLPTLAEGALQIINVDVGQGDALLILHRGKSMLVDCGVSLRDPRAARRLPRRLDALLGHRHLDYFMISHYHQDHVGAPGHQPNREKPGGIYALIEQEGVTIGTLLDRGFWSIGPPGATQRHYEAASARWLRSGIATARRVVQVGDELDMGEGLRVQVVAASGNGLLDQLQRLFPAFYETATPSENDYSVGIKLTYGRFEMFTAGDLSGRNAIRQYGPHRETYTDIESRVARSVGPVEVYRVNHHGSRHSSNPCFTQVLHPQVSVFSTGVNAYGHPDEDVYRRLKGYGDVYITGGIDPRRREVVAPSEIVGDDVEILAAPDGERYWVNGHPYRALSDAEELARPLGALDHCAAADHAIQPEHFEIEDGEIYAD